MIQKIPWRDQGGFFEKSPLLHTGNPEMPTTGISDNPASFLRTG